MSNNSLDLQALAQRLERLEKQNPRLKRVGIIALLALASFVLMGQAATKRRVEANEFILKDSDGRVKAAASDFGVEAECAVRDSTLSLWDHFGSLWAE